MRRIAFVLAVSLGLVSVLPAPSAYAWRGGGGWHGGGWGLSLIHI